MVRRLILALLLAAGLLLAPTGVAAGAEGDQCGKPVTERVGGWVCFEPGVDQLAQQGFCNSSGCYTRRDDFRATYESIQAAWGYGGAVLGWHEHLVTWQMQGGQMHASPVRFRNSINTVDVVFSGSMVNASPGAPGSLIDGTLGFYNAGNVPAHTWHTWTPNGFVSYDTANWDHAQVIQFSWSHPDRQRYPGYWFAYVKSPSARSTDQDLYRFRSPIELPADPHGGGYRL